MERVHVDVAQYRNRNCLILVLVDAFSSWFDCKIVSSLSSVAVISSLKGTFKYVDIPVILVTADSGTNFASREFRDFAQSVGFNTFWPLLINKPMAMQKDWYARHWKPCRGKWRRKRFWGLAETVADWLFVINATALLVLMKCGQTTNSLRLNFGRSWEARLNLQTSLTCWY